MAILQIRGGDLDLVEYDFTPFNPGENIRTANITCIREPNAEAGTFHIRAPARIHLSVLDMNRFSPGTPGGGGIGFALQLYHEAEVSAAEKTEIESSRHLLIRHLEAAFKKVTGYTGGFRIKTCDHGREHIGLGSTCTTAVAVLTGMNEAAGRPLDNEGIRMLLGNNYVEETDAEGKVVFGFETGLGALASLNGGMNIIGDKLTPICSHPFAEGYHIYIVIPKTHAAEENAGENEFSLLMNHARLLDTRDRELKAYMIMMDFIPALVRGDIKTMGDIIWELEFRGSKRAEVQHHSFIIYQHMNALRSAGLEFVAMSSVGPSVCVITEKDEEEMQKIADSIGLEIAVSTRADNVGLTVEKREG